MSSLLEKLVLWVIIIYIIAWLAFVLWCFFKLVEWAAFMFIGGV